MHYQFLHSMMSKFVVLFLCATMSLAMMSKPVFAAEYPTKPITMIVAYGAGGGSDLAARTVAKFMEKYLGQPVVVENRSGAGGQIGFTALVKAKPDGYTIGMLNVPTLNILANLRPNPTFKTEQLQPIGNAILDPVVLAVGAKSQFKTMQEFIDFAKKNPDEIILGVDGPQTSSQLQAVIMDEALGIKVKYVFYAGAAPALTAAIGGHTFGTTPGASEAQQYVESGQLRVLTVFSDQRFPGLPDVPTFKEVTGMDIDYVPSNRGFGVPVGVPDAIKVKLEDALKKVVADPEFLAKAKEIGLPIYFESAETFGKKINQSENAIIRYKDILSVDK